MKNYYRVFSQIDETPTISVHDIASNTGIARNTVSKYLKEMYARCIMKGPHLRINPASNYKEYVYLMNFLNPYKVFRGLRKFPHVIYHGMSFGDWNTIVVTNRLLDFSHLVGFQNIVHQGMRGYSYTPRVGYTTWDEAFERVGEQVKQFAPLPELPSQQLIQLPWQKDQWRLFHMFKYNMRQAVTPVLKGSGVRYETYSQWMATLDNYCTIHTGFYPEGHRTYLHYCFLFSTDCKRSIMSLFSLFPTTSFFMEVGNQLLVFTSTASNINKFFCFIYSIKNKGIIKGFSQSVALFYKRHSS